MNDRTLENSLDPERDDAEAPSPDDDDAKAPDTGTWVRKWTPPPVSHECRFPVPTHHGDLWRCWCGALWEVEAYRLAGVSPTSPSLTRWRPASRRDRVRYSAPVRFVIDGWCGLRYL